MVSREDRIERIDARYFRLPLAEDFARASAVREVLGTDHAFTVDANCALTEAQSIEAARGFDD